MDNKVKHSCRKLGMIKVLKDCPTGKHRSLSKSATVTCEHLDASRCSKTGNPSAFPKYCFLPAPHFLFTNDHIKQDMTSPTRWITFMWWLRHSRVTKHYDFISNSSTQIQWTETGNTGKAYRPHSFGLHFLPLDDSRDDCTSLYRQQR